MGISPCKEPGPAPSCNLPKPPLHPYSRIVTLFALMNLLMYLLTLGFILPHSLLLFLLLDTFSAERLTSNEFEFLGKQRLSMCGDDVLSPLPNFNQFVLSVMRFLQVSCRLVLRGGTPYQCLCWGKAVKSAHLLLDMTKHMWEWAGLDRAPLVLG